MTLQEIASNLRQDAQSGALNLTASYFNLDSFRLLLDLLEVRQLQVQTAPEKVIASGGRVDVNGSSTVMGLPAEVTLSLEAGNDNQIDCSLSTTLSSLTLSDLAQNGFIPTTKLDPSVFLPDAFDGVALVAQSKTKSLTMTIEESAHGWSLLEDIHLNLSNVGFALTRSFQNGSQNVRIEMAILGKISIGSTPLDVKLDLPIRPLSLPDRWALSIAAESPVSATLADLSHLFMGTDAAASLPPGISQAASFTLEKLGIVFDPVAKSVAMVSLTLGSTTPLTLAEKIVIEQVKISFLVLMPRGSWVISTEVFGGIKFGDHGMLAIKMIIPSASNNWSLSLTEPLNLSGIADMSHIPGDVDHGDLNLPNSLSNSGTLWITRFELRFNPGQLSVSWISLGVSFDADWNVFSDVSVGMPRIAISITEPFDSSRRALAGSISGMITIGSAAIHLQATKSGPASAWQLTGQLEEGQTVGLVELINSLLPGNTALPAEIQSMAVKDIAVSLDTNGNAFSFSGQTASPWNFSLGPKTVELTASVQFESHLNATTNQKEASGKLAGEIDIGGARFQLTYQFDPAKKILEGAWADATNHLGFESLASEFGINLPSIDSSVSMPDLGLKSASFEIDFDKALGDTFTFTADSASFGKAFFMLKKDAQQQWGFAFAVALPDGWKHLSQIGGTLGGDLSALDFIEFDAALFMLATSEFKGLQVAGFPGLGQYPMHVKPGFSVGTVVDFVKAGSNSDANSKALGQLGRIANQDAMLLETSVGPPADMALVADLPGSVSIDGAEGKKLTLSNCAIEMRIAPLAITLKGSLVFPVGGTNIDATGRLTISASEALATFDLKAEDRYLPIPMGFKGVHLTEVGVAMGIVFEPPQVDVGLAGKFVIGEPPSPIPAYTPTQRSITAMPQDDEFVFIFGLAEEAINPLLLSFYVAEISLNDMVVALLDNPVSLPAVVSDIRATEVMLFWCDAPTQTPDGTPANPVFGFNANLDLWGFHAHANLMINATSGFTGDAYMDPININGVLALTGSGTGTPETYTGAVKVNPGGPVIHVSTHASPFLSIDWNLVLFNTISQAVTAEVTKQGFAFDIAYKVGDVFASHLSCSLESRTHFQMSFSINLNLELGPFEILGADVGKIYLVDVGFDAALDVNVTPDFVLTIDGDFILGGAKQTMPQVRLAVAPESLEKLPQLVADKFAQEAETIFSGLFDSARHLIQGGLDEARSLGVEADEMARILAGEGGQVVSEITAVAENTARQIEQDADRIAQAVYHDMQEVEKAFNEAQQEVEALAKRAEEEAERLANAAEAEAARVASEAASLARAAANKAKDIVNGVGNAVTEGARSIWNAIRSL